MDSHRTSLQPSTTQKGIIYPQFCRCYHKQTPLPVSDLDNFQYELHDNLLNDDTYTADDPYMFPAHIFNDSPQSSILHTSTQESPEPTYEQLTIPTSAVQLQFHPAIKNPGRPKRSLNFGSPSTPYKKRQKI